MRFGDDTPHISFQVRANNERFGTVHVVRKKHMDIHQMQGSVHLILHAETDEHTSNVQFRTVHFACQNT